MEKCKSCSKAMMKKAKGKVKVAAKKSSSKVKSAAKKSKNKVSIVMEEFKKGELHSGSKKGPKVHNPKQAIAIALSEARKAKKKSKK